MQTVKISFDWQKYIEIIDSKLLELTKQDSIQSTFHSILRPVIREAVSGGGKRIRPILTLLSCEAVGGDLTHALPIAIAYELAHNASIIQDDIIDHSDTRRKSPSIYARYGLPAAIIAADYLIFDLFHKAAYYLDSLPPKMVQMLLRYLGDSAKDTALGEAVDTQLTDRSFTVDAYVSMVGLKTGSLLGASAASGVIVGRGSEKEIAAMDRAGRDLGVAFQIRDDILDIVGDPSILGKPILSDVTNRRNNVVLIHALRTALNSDEEFLYLLLGKKTFNNREIDRLRAIFSGLGSLEYAQTLAYTFARRARAQFSTLKPTNARDMLLELTHFVVNRSN